MKDNYPVNKSVMNYIHARDFFPEGDAENYKLAVDGLKFVPMKYGLEIPEFNMIFPDIDVLWGKMLGDILDIEENESGVFRRPYPDVIHFEDFESLDEWRFVVSLDNMEFKTYRHVSGAKNMLHTENGDYSQFDFFDENQWERETSIIMKPNDAIFYRPWIFHSFSQGLLHYYKIKVQ
jgi:hypothetical protein